VDSAHTQNRSRQARRHRASHWFLACLTSYDVLFCRSAYIVCVLRKLKKKFLVDLI
jgi:hypothetical protein